jgi:hypothetical protein
VKKSEIAPAVFDATNRAPLERVGGGPLAIPVGDLAALAHVPWFCDASVQWALRIEMPGAPVSPVTLKKVKGTSVAVSEKGAALIGIPGDGIAPCTGLLTQFADAVGVLAVPGTSLELATANLGVVKRDWQAKSETSSKYGDQRYTGAVNTNGEWEIARSAPAMTAVALNTAIECGRMVTQAGPWTTKSRDEAHAVMVEWLSSAAANVNPLAVKRFITFRDGAFVNSDPGMVRLLFGLAQAFMRVRLAGGSLQWTESVPPRTTPQEIEDVEQAVIG